MQTMLTRDTIGTADSCLVYLLVSDFGLEWFGGNVLKQKHPEKKKSFTVFTESPLDPPNLQTLLQGTTVDPLR